MGTISLVGITGVNTYLNSYYGIIFGTSATSISAGTVRAMITNGGNVLIGTTTDSGYKLDISGVTRFQNIVRFKNDAWNLSDDGYNRFYFSGAGKTYFGSGNGYEWRSAADVYVGECNDSGVWYASNSYRAPVFYDSGNTAYFVDPAASTSAIFAGSVKATQYLITPNGTNAVYNIVDSNATYAGLYIMQAGGGSAGFGGGFIAYGHAHASKPGWVTAGISASSSGKFTVNTQGLGGGTDLFVVQQDGNVGIGTTSPSYKLDVNGNTNVTGTLTATTKSFIIDHPTKPNKRLQYGVLEGPEHSVYTRGRLRNTNTIMLPDHWHALVDESTITVNLTPIGEHDKLWVVEITPHYIIIGSESNSTNCFYSVFAERKDVDKLVIELDK